MTVGPELALVIPLVGAVGIGLTGSKPNLREAVTLLCAATLLGCVSLIAAQVLQGEHPRWEGPLMGPGLQLVLEVEPLGLLYAMVGAVLWIPNSIYSIGYMRGHHERNQTRFYICFALALSSVMGIAFSGNLPTLFVFYETLTLSTFPLIAHHGSPQAKRSGRIYLGILFSTSMLFLLLGICWAGVANGGDLSFKAGGILGGVDPGVRSVLFVLFVLGIGKAALMPFHFWLPAAMVAPTPVSALLHAVAVVKAGVFCMLKIMLYVFGLDVVRDQVHHEWLMSLAAFTILVSSIVALNQDNLKARLAYSTVSQLSYIVLGASLGSVLGILGGGLHVAMHATGKITLFFCAGAIYVAAGKTKVSQLDGLGRSMPVTMGCFAVGAMSIIGLPPLGGAWSKWYLGLATLDSAWPWLLAVLMVSSLLNVAYLMPIPIRAFFLPPPSGGPEPSGIQEAPLPCLIAMVITAILSLLLFFAPELALALPELALGGKL
ncbi:MAG: monovalent cation/H+ antiporter subunit D family protein [Planctomycetes bacterium]|nr:monovalent cation/H+ antiporter subunit D family protein [Planctomycetota bacterium]